MASIRVIHLELEGEHYYFGSPKAMFDIIGPERLGMSYKSFHSNIRLNMEQPYINRRRGYIVRVGMLGQARTNRNNGLKELMANIRNNAEQTASATATPQPAPAAPKPKTAAPKKNKKATPPEQLTLF